MILKGPDSFGLFFLPFLKAFCGYEVFIPSYYHPLLFFM